MEKEAISCLKIHLRTTDALDYTVRCINSKDLSSHANMLYDDVTTIYVKRVRALRTLSFLHNEINISSMNTIKGFTQPRLAYETCRDVRLKNTNPGLPSRNC